MSIKNVTPDHFCTANGEMVLKLDADGYPRPVPTQSEIEHQNSVPHMGRIALALYQNGQSAAGNGELETIVAWARQFKRS